MVKKQDPTWMILAIVFGSLMLISLIGWIVSASNSSYYRNLNEKNLDNCVNNGEEIIGYWEDLSNYYQALFNQLVVCYENNLPKCNYTNINNQYSYLFEDD